MTLQFQHIFAGIGMGRGKIKNDALIYGTSVFIEKFAEASVARLGNIPNNPLRQGLQIFARNPYYTDATASERSSDGSNDVGIFHPGK